MRADPHGINALCDALDEARKQLAEALARESVLRAGLTAVFEATGFGGKWSHLLGDDDGSGYACLRVQLAATGGPLDYVSIVEIADDDELAGDAAARICSSVNAARKTMEAAR